MRQLVLLVLLALAHVAFGEASLRITAPEFHDQPVVLFRYMDLFTLRLSHSRQAVPMRKAPLTSGPK